MNSLPRLQICSRNPHLMETADGKPFFMLGDTAWELAHRLDFEEIQFYFKTRAAQGFNMIWFNLLAEFDGLREADRNGEVPFHGMDPNKPNEKYFAWIDRIVAEAAAHGLYCGILPTWGDKLTAPWGAGPKIFSDTQTMARYGEYLSKRYKDSTNLLWVLGGDRPAKIAKGSWMEDYAKNMGIDPASDWTPLWRALALAIQTEIPNALITYHPQGGGDSTSTLIHHEKWLHMNAMQSGHGGGRDVPVWEYVERDYNMLPVKPTYDSEPNYEDHPVSPWPTFNPQNGYFDEYDVRRQNWRSVFAGGCGVIYGHHSIWGFASHRHPWINHTKMDWREAIIRPGAIQMRHLKELIESTGMVELVPDQSLLVGKIGEKAEHMRAIRKEDRSWIAVYVPHNGPAVIHTSDVERKRAEWLDPRTGKRQSAKGDSGNGITTFQKPNDIDWVLVLG
ncbi:MAG: glycoside hydrolase family 140 protein [Armatimonadota bacterium]